MPVVETRFGTSTLQGSNLITETTVSSLQRILPRSQKHYRLVTVGNRS
jgi:hypothetical protein